MLRADELNRAPSKLDLRGPGHGTSPQQISVTGKGLGDIVYDAALAVERREKNTSDVKRWGCGGTGVVDDVFVCIPRAPSTF